MKKTLSYILVFVLALTLIGSANTSDVYAKTKKPNLNKKNVRLYVGKKQKIRLKNPSKKVKWKVSNKKIVKIVKKYGKKNNTIKIKGLKAGKTKITARVGKKKYIVKVTVKKRRFTGKQPPTTEVTTTPEITSHPPETTVIETTTEEPTTNIEVTTPEETTTVEPGKLVAVLEDDTLVSNQDPVINFYMDAPTDLVIGLDYNPYKLEVLQNEQWIELQQSDTFTGIVGIVGVSWEHPISACIPLTYVYGNLGIGHYRYTHRVGWHHTNTSEQDYPSHISVEFDVVPNEDGLNIVAKAKNDKLEPGQDLELEINVLANTNSIPVSCTKKPIDLQGYDFGFMEWWYTYGGQFPDSANNEVSLNKLGTTTVTIPINEYFGDLSPGYYRYIFEVDGIELFVDFYIIEPLSVTAKATDDKMTLGEQLEVTLSITGLYKNSSFSFNTYEIGLLEVYKNGEWAVAPTNPDSIGYPEPLFSIYGTLSGKTSYTYTIDLDDYYLLEDGHYRYTIPFMPYTDHPNATFEFDIVE